MSGIVAIADTSGLLGLFNRQDKSHADCLRVRAAAAHLVISPLVLAELDYLITSRSGPDVALAVLDHIMDAIDLRRYEVPEVSAHLRSARAVMSRYKSMNIGLADAMNVALAAEFRTDAVFTLDREHFRAVRPLTAHPCFRLLPDDLDR
ncbi:PIN domain-containing protein [Allostreptomyces psammosilenae]|uniref:Ribonuclease VapC n=1 Tax=Allostreptomyces psammosilenae TaxID=1892865 RepID=A0A853ABJ8_9ACTN|nr:PIN domain-containing protein [Allostreptomyces psammosilenae]NYI07858.1 putative nucleic acid-binding protein [Allostreptomyces psammosilenae]